MHFLFCVSLVLLSSVGHFISELSTSHSHPALFARWALFCGKQHQCLVLSPCLLTARQEEHGQRRVELVKLDYQELLVNCEALGGVYPTHQQIFEGRILLPRQNDSKPASATNPKMSFTSKSSSSQTHIHVPPYHSREPLHFFCKTPSVLLTLQAKY